MTTATFALEGMHCTSCAAAVEKSLLKAPGVAEAQVSFATDSLHLSFDEALTTLADLQARIAKLGYQLLAEPSGGGDEAALGRALNMRIAVVAFGTMWAMLASFPLWLGQAQEPAAAWALWIAANLLALPALIYAGWPFYILGWRTLRLGAPGMDALVLIGVAGAVVLTLLAPALGRIETYADMALTLLAGQLIAKRLDLTLRQRARASLAGLLAATPIRARVITSEGTSLRLLAEVVVGEQIELFAGEGVPVDGVVTEGRAALDRALRTGESLPVAVGPGERVHAGDVVLDARLLVTVQATAGQRWLDRLSGQVKAAWAQKGDWHKLADQYARHFIVIAAGLAAVGAAVALAQGGGAAAALERALAVFVIACPCALSFAAPLASRMLTARLAREGVLLRDPQALERYRRPDVILLDKTGTLTRHGLHLQLPLQMAEGQSEAEVLGWASMAARGSSHPIARAVIAASGEPRPQAGESLSLPGQGLQFTDAAGAQIHLGSAAWLASLGIALPAQAENQSTQAHLARNQHWVASLTFSSELDSAAVSGVAELKAMAGQLQILSGDRPEAVAPVAAALGLAHSGGLAPGEKLQRVADARKAGHYTLFVGDGLNDSPALAAADLGVAVQGAADLARISANLVFERGGVAQVPSVLRLFARAKRVLRQNLFWALAYNAVAAPLAIAGWVHPAMAAAAMAASSVTVVLNASRLLWSGRFSA